MIIVLKAFSNKSNDLHVLLKIGGLVPLGGWAGMHQYVPKTRVGQAIPTRAPIEQSGKGSNGAVGRISAIWRVDVLQAGDQVYRAIK